MATSANNESSELVNQPEPKHSCKVIRLPKELLDNSEIRTDVDCTESNCGEKFSHVSALNLHLKKFIKLILK